MTRHLERRARTMLLAGIVVAVISFALAAAMGWG